jgi:hypothetical protein
MGTTFIGPTMNVALNWGSGSNSGQLFLGGGSFTLASTGNYNQSSGATFVTNISANQTTGILNIGTAGAREGAININTGGTSIAPVNISSGTNANAPITIGSTASTTQTATHNAITTFSKIPLCSVAPVNNNELCNKLYVDNVAGGSGFVTLTTTQTISGEKTFTGDTFFTGAVEVGPATLTAVDINVSGLLDVQDVYIHGNLNVGTVVINESGVGDLEMNNPTNGGKYIFKVDDTGGVSREALNLSASTATFYGDIDTPSLTASYISNTGSIDTPSVTSGLQTDDLNVGQNQTSGKLFLGCRSDRTGSINIGTLVTGNAPIVVGSTSSTTQTATHNAITTFNKIPLCSGVPATGDHLVNKTYTDGTFVKLTGNETIAGIKTFSSVPLCATAPTTGTQLTNKTYVDGAITTAGGSYMDLTTNQTAAGIKTFSSIPQCAINSIGDNDDLINYGTLNQRFTDERPYFNPVGTVIIYAGSTAPTGYLLCNGTLYSQFTYPSLFSVIFNTYGGGFPNFRVPNYNGAFLRGSGSQTVGGVTYSGSTLGTSQQDSVLALSSITNQGYYNVDSGGGGASRQLKSRVRIGTDPLDSGTFGAGIDPTFPRQNTTENRPFNHTVNYCIKF